MAWLWTIWKESIFKCHKSIDNSNNFNLILSWKTSWKQKFSRENSKPHHESWITNHNSLSWTLLDKTHHEKKKVIVIRNAMVNNINEHGLSKWNKILVKNFPSATSEKYLKKWMKLSVKNQSLLSFMQKPMMWPTISNYQIVQK